MLLITVFVDHELPEAVSRAGSSEVLEIEREDRQVLTFRDCHHGRIGIAKVQISKASIQLGSTAKQRRRNADHRVLARGQRLQEKPRDVAADT